MSAIAMPKASVKAQANLEPVDLYIYGEIGSSWWNDGVDSVAVAEFLAGIPKDQPINLRINSPGGAVGEGLAIYNLLRDRSNVSAQVDGYACSSASFLLLAADTRVFPTSAIGMIHPPSGGCWGTAKDMRSMADALDVHDAAVRSIYLERTNLTEDELDEYLEAETWFTGKEALEMGFATAAPEEELEIEDKVLPMQFQQSAQRYQDKITAAGWKFGKGRGSGRGAIAANANIPMAQQVKDFDAEVAAEVEKIVNRAKASKVSQKTGEPPMTTEPEATKPVEANSDRITQMSDDIRNLKVQLQAAQKAKQESDEAIAQGNLKNQYWQLRATAIDLYAIQNKLTEEDFRLEFSEDPEIDLENLTTMNSDDARIEIRMKSRLLQKSSAKQAIERVADPAGRAKLENSVIRSQAVDIDPGQREALDAKPESPYRDKVEKAKATIQNAWKNGAN